MTRPLISLSAGELAGILQRNRTNGAELLLVQDELRHRDGAAVRALTLEVAKLLGTLQLSTPQTDGMTAAEVARLRSRLLDLSKKNSLISFKHSGRSASSLRLVDTRLDRLDGQLQDGTSQGGTLCFEPLPGVDTVPPDERTETFQIAYERARLTDPEFLAVTDGEGEGEDDAASLEKAEQDLRSRVRAQLGLPQISYGKGLDVKALAAAHGFDPSFELKWSASQDIPKGSKDRVRVLMVAKELDKRLKSIWERHRSHMRETGFHTLYLALGFVEWFDGEDSRTALHAPLLLLPVKLERKQVRNRYEYTLQLHDEGLQVNVALVEKARQHWNLALPALEEDEAPESYCRRAAAVLAEGDRLRLRLFATLAVLPFPRMVLWKDLDQATWPASAFDKHRLLPALLGASPMPGGDGAGEGIDVDHPDWASRAPALIRPADASQHAALIDVAEGHDLAIEGPPGTGKSQTITNMVASALAQGKRVLFVAEKQAALRVVADRLRESGLGPLLLELHGDDANRTAVYDSLRDRLKVRGRLDARQLESRRQDLAERRNYLRRYLALLQQSCGTLGLTVYQLIWKRLALAEGLGPDLCERATGIWRPTDVIGLKEADLRTRRRYLTDFGKALAAIHVSEAGRGRTLWLGVGQLDPFDQRSQLEAATAAAEAAAALWHPTRALEAAGLVGDFSPWGPLDRIATQLEAIEVFSDVADVAVIAVLRAPEAVRALLSQQGRWRKLLARLREDVDDPTAVAPHAVVHLTTALAALPKIPETGGQARRNWQIQVLLHTVAKSTDADWQEFVSLVGLPADATMTELAKVSATIQALARQDPTVQALYSKDLLDPVISTVSAEARAEAEQLQARRSELADTLASDVFAADPAELVRLADTLDGTPAIARWLSGAFRGASRQVRRWGSVRIKPLEAAETLRQVARWRRANDTFREQHPIKSCFPSLLWKGADSEWEALSKAHAALRSASSSLLQARHDSGLRAYLELDRDGRAKVGALADRLAEAAVRLADAGYADVKVTEILASVARDEGIIGALVTALEAVGVIDDGLIVRDDGDLAARLGTLQACAAEFDLLKALPELQWVGFIEAPLDGLARASGQVAHLDAIAGPIDLLAALRKSSAPIQQLADISMAAVDWRACVVQWAQATTRLADAASYVPIEDADVKAFLPQGSAAWPVLADRLSLMGKDREGAALAADLRKYQAAVDDAGLGNLANAALAGKVGEGQLPDLHDYIAISLLLEMHMRDEGVELGRIGGLTLESARAEFVATDMALQVLEAQSVLERRLQDKPPPGIGHGPRGTWTEMALLDNELGLKKSRTSLRDVVRRSATALAALKPVWMMSPASVAQYITPGSLQFNLLIVDEASQMRPEYAVSAVMRAAQFVVVGDCNQLPPSNHFELAETASDEDAEDTAGSADAESILDLATQRFRCKRRLRWHYRSQHESLIQFSNREFYKKDLVVFPSAHGNQNALLGVRCTYVPNIYSDTLYDASINQREAQAVIDEAFRLMQLHPEQTLGIVAMNAKQTELINAEFQRLQLEHSEIRDFIASYANTPDEFFIKNLENVQGDERDIILISTVYGKGKEGVVRQNFGLVGRADGWRRLNVLVTRAKVSTRVFTSLYPGDIKIAPTTPRGTRAFADYLTYAFAGAASDDPLGGASDSDFELFVADALREAGYEVVHQVGVEGFRIDLGLRHADCPIGFIAGIECDGAPYHSGLSVRDRDAIRQRQLETLGWKIYRVWSVDWYANPRREAERLLAQVNAWQELAVARFASQRPEQTAEIGLVQPLAEDNHIANLSDDAVALVPVAVAPPSPPIEPTHLKRRDLDGIAWYEIVKGSLFEVWQDGLLAGEVEVISRANHAPQLYNGRVVTARSEYEGTVTRTGDRFRMSDIYATVREVARRASFKL